MWGVMQLESAEKGFFAAWDSRQGFAGAGDGVRHMVAVNVFQRQPHISGDTLIKEVSGKGIDHDTSGDT